MQEQFIHLAANIVTANATGRGLSSEQIVEMIKSVASTLESLGNAPVAGGLESSPETKPTMTWQQSIGKNAVTCLICGFQGKTLNSHIRRKHSMSGKEYAAQFGIPSKTPLVSKAYSAKRSKMAKDSGLGEHLRKAREAKKEAAGTKESAAPAKAKKSKKETAV